MDISLVNNIIEQIAYGKNTVNEIATKLGETAPAILYSLEKIDKCRLGTKEKMYYRRKK